MGFPEFPPIEYQTGGSYGSKINAEIIKVPKVKNYHEPCWESSR